jgi:tetratricopeptide (TPR) repeat protein
MTTPGLDPLIVLALLIPVFYLSIFAHELGHALMGRAVGFVVTSFGVGTGRPFWTLTVRGVRIFFCHSNPLAGFTFWLIPCFSPARYRLVPFFAGGLLANGLLAATAIFLWKLLPRGELLWAWLSSVNAILLVSSLIPYRQKVGKATVQSDGWLILSALRSNSLNPSAPLVIQMTRAFRGLWEAIGDVRSLRAYLAASAASWAELGDPEQATASLAEARSLPAIETPYYLAYESLVRAGIASETHRLDEALIALGEAEDCFRKAADPVGMLYVSLYRAQILIARGDTAEATALLDVLAHDRQLERNALLRIALEGVRLSASMRLPDPGSADENFARYVAICRKQPSSTRDLRVYRAVARFYAARGECSKAEPAFRAAVAAIHDLAGAWSDPADRSRFVQIQSPCLAEARECLRMLNKEEEAERLIRPLASPADLQPIAAAAAVQRDRRCLRIGVWLILANVVCMVGTIALVDVLPPHGSLPVFMLIFGCFLSTGVAAVYLLVRVTVGRLFPALRRNGGAAILMLACLPWLMLVVIPVLLMLMGP